MEPFFAPNLSVAETSALLQPWLNELAALGIVVEPIYNNYPSFYSAWMANFPQETIGQDDIFIGSRLFPRQNWENKTLLNATFEEYKKSSDLGLITINFNMAPTLAAGGYPDNAVNPAWRNSLMHSIQGASFAENATKEEIIAARVLYRRGKLLGRRLRRVRERIWVRVMGGGWVSGELLWDILSASVGD